MTVKFAIAGPDLMKAKREAEKALLDGRETVLHGHAAYSQTVNHRHCEWYVLDWHDDPPVEWADMRQVAVIHPEPLEADRSVA